MTPEDLDEALGRIRAAMPSLGPEAEQTGLAMEVIAHFLSPQWLAERIVGPSPEKYFQEWRTTDADADAETFVALHRISSLGRSLYELQRAPGFDAELNEVRTNRLQGAAYELWVALRLKHFGCPVTFRPRSGVKGQDYEFDVDIAGTSVAVEAKACNDRRTNEFGTATITNILDRAAGQLPASQPSVVFVSVPWRWGGDPEVRARSTDAARDWIRNHSRVNRVYLEFEEAVPIPPAGGGIIYRQAVVDNAAPRTPMDLDALGRGVRVGNGPVSIRWAT